VAGLWGCAHIFLVILAFTSYIPTLPQNACGWGTQTFRARRGNL
jgi:hypothetical protein